MKIAIVLAESWSGSYVVDAYSSVDRANQAIEDMKTRAEVLRSDPRFFDGEGFSEEESTILNYIGSYDLRVIETEVIE